MLLFYIDANIISNNSITVTISVNLSYEKKKIKNTAISTTCIDMSSDTYCCQANRKGFIVYNTIRSSLHRETNTTRAARHSSFGACFAYTLCTARLVCCFRSQLVFISIYYTIFVFILYTDCTHLLRLRICL